MRQEPIPSSLAEEGRQMLKALMEDLLAIPGLELVVMQDDRLPLPFADSRIQSISISADANFQAIWLKSINDCDAIWPIAPETDGILERLCLDVENAGKPLLTSPSAAVRLTSSKLTTLKRLSLHGLPTAPSFALPDWKPQAGPFVIKPDDGVGCEGIRIIQDPAAFQPPTDTENWIAQPLLEGAALSLSALFAHGAARLLSCNRQLIERSGEGFSLNGCEVNAFDDADGRWQSLAAQIAQAIPELWGYVGIDLILSAGGPTILEINPRLTTSYAGLRTATGENPAAMVLELWKTHTLPAFRTELGRPVVIRLEQSL